MQYFKLLRIKAQQTIAHLLILALLPVARWGDKPALRPLFNLYFYRLLLPLALFFGVERPGDRNDR